MEICGSLRPANTPWLMKDSNISLGRKKKKLKTNNSLIVKANKGQTVVIISGNEHMKKSYMINKNDIE